MKNIEKIKKLSWVILGIAALVQIIFFPTMENIFGTLIVVAAWLLTTNLLLDANKLINFPVSIFVILGYVLSQSYLPLLFTLIEFKPVTYNLNLSYYVFLHFLLGLIVVLLAHTVYRNFFTRWVDSFRAALHKRSFFTPPTQVQMWMIGFVGILSMSYSYFVAKSVTQTTGNADDKFIQSLTPFVYTPYIILLGSLFGTDVRRTKQLTFFFVIYTILLFGLSMAVNSRTVFVQGLASLGFAYGLGILLNILPVPKFSWKLTVFGLAVLLLVQGPMSNLGVAMVLVRAQRSDMSAVELITETMAAYNNTYEIEKQKESEKKVEKFAWDENYLNNLFLARFCNIKYNDLSLEDAHRLDGYNEKMFEFSMNRILATLPNPFLVGLGIMENKDAVTGFSFGDYLHAQATEGAGAIGGFRTGHFAGTGMAAFGWWYLLLLGVVMIPSFLVFDSLYTRVAIYDEHTLVGIRPIFSVCFLISIMPAFQFLSAESVVVPITFLIRGWLQMILLYFILFKTTKLITRFFA